MQKRKLLTLMACSTLLLFTACGSSSSSNGVTPLTETNTETNTNTDINTETKTNTVPEKINITIPKGLKRRRKVIVQGNSSKVSFQKTTESIESYGYEQLKSTIEEAESTIKHVKENMIYLGGMMPDIQTACEGTNINEPCSIPAGQISLTIDSSILSALEELQNEFDNIEEKRETPPLNTVLPIGKILYTQFDSNHTYQQDIVVDLKPTFLDLNITVTKLLETIRWSKDKKNVETISDVDNEFGTFYMHLTYTKKDDNTSFMRIKNKFINPARDGFTAAKGQFSMTLQELNDINETVKITSSGKFSDGTFNDSFDSSGQINVNGGYLKSNGTFEGNSNYAEKETFDTNGSLLQSKYCDEDIGETCSISNESTWHTFDDDLGIDDNDFSEDDFEYDDDFSDDNWEDDSINDDNFDDALEEDSVNDDTLNDELEDDTIDDTLNDELEDVPEDDSINEDTLNDDDFKMIMVI